MNTVAVRDLISPEAEPFFSSHAKLCVHPKDIEVLKCWTRTAEIEVAMEDMLSRYPLRLINHETGHSIRVKVAE